MRERTLPIRLEKLAILSSLHRSTRIAKSLNISKQRWGNYKSGRHDMPENILDDLCRLYHLNKADLIAPIESKKVQLG